MSQESGTEIEVEDSTQAAESNEDEEDNTTERMFTLVADAFTHIAAEISKPTTTPVVKRLLKGTLLTLVRHLYERNLDEIGNILVVARGSE
jgi:hypothetical protein